MIYSDIHLTVYMIIVGIVTDLLDGHLARSFGYVTTYGHRLDLIADATCFSFLPFTYIWIIQKSQLEALLLIISLLIYTLFRVQTM